MNPSEPTDADASSAITISSHRLLVVQLHMRGEFRNGEIDVVDDSIGSDVVNNAVRVGVVG